MSDTVEVDEVTIPIDDAREAIDAVLNEDGRATSEEPTIVGDVMVVGDGWDDADGYVYVDGEGKAGRTNLSNLRQRLGTFVGYLEDEDLFMEDVMGSDLEGTPLDAGDAYASHSEGFTESELRQIDESDGARIVDVNANHGGMVFIGIEDTR